MHFHADFTHTCWAESDPGLHVRRKVVKKNLRKKKEKKKRIYSEYYFNYD